MSKVNNVDLEEVKLKLYEKLKPSGWGDKLKTFIMSDDFDRILKVLLKESQEGKKFTPIMKQVFRAFEECPYNELKVVMIGQDPYPYLGVADGIAFSCSNTGKPEASLRYMFKEIEDTVYPTEGYTWDPDLKRWSNQGMLILNTAFTTSIGKIGQHFELWKPLMNFLLDHLNYTNSGLIYVFLGRKAEEYMDIVSDNNHKIVCSHPASAAYNKLEKWDSNDMFNKVYNLVDKNYKYKIVW